jgi:SAM-dependent methyltransferase
MGPPRSGGCDRVTSKRSPKGVGITARRSHPCAAWVYNAITPLADRAGGSEHRALLLKSLAGRVIEIGCGQGRNFAHYPSPVTTVTALEPEPYLRRLALGAAGLARVRVEVIGAEGEELPFSDASFDAGVVSLVLCSVIEPGRALSELRRVIRPGGELRVYEHVRATTAGDARLQDIADPFWRRIAGGCRCNRDTEAAIAEAGFDLTVERRGGFTNASLARRIAPVIIGVAT